MDRAIESRHESTPGMKTVDLVCVALVNGVGHDLGIAITGLFT